MEEKTKNWIYKDYKVAVFTTREEMTVEGKGKQLDGYVRFYPDAILEKAGALIDRADRWQSQVVRHNELITGQNPFSHEVFGRTFVNTLKGS